jgi:resuscitation-promoting factor RpfA
VANGGSRPVAPVRKLIAAVLGTVAAFVVLFGLGMTSWAIVALGVALVVLAVALATVQGGGRTWVIGMAHVHTVSEPPTAYAFGRCELQIMIDAPGMPPRSKKIIEPRVPIAKWPTPGQTLPIRVALDDQRHVRVLWDEVPTHTETAGMTDLPPEFDDRRDELDDLLIQQDAPPWAGRDPDDGLRAPGPGDPVTADLSDELAGLRQEREPVVMRHTPGGTIVLEGTVVEPAPAGTLPRRSTTAPRPRFEEPVDVHETVRTGSPARTDEAARSAAGDPLDVALAVDDPPAPPRPAPQDDVDDPGFLYVVDTPRPGADRPGNDRPGDDSDDRPTVTEPTGADPTGADRPDGEGTVADDTDEPLIAPAPDGRIGGVGMTLLVTDLARSVAFYRDRLGLLEIDGGDGNAVLASGSTRVVLREITEAAPINRRLVHLNLEVDGIEAAYERLRDSGVRFTYAPRVVNRGAKLELWAAAFRDPDGHGIALSEWRERRPAPR